MFRTLSVRVTSEKLICFRLSKDSYHTILSDLNAVKRIHRYNFLKEIFKITPTFKLYDINSAVSDI